VTEALADHPTGPKMEDQEGHTPTYMSGRSGNYKASAAAGSETIKIRILLKHRRGQGVI